MIKFVTIFQLFFDIVLQFIIKLLNIFESRVAIFFRVQSRNFRDAIAIALFFRDRDFAGKWITRDRVATENRVASRAIARDQSRV